MQPKQVDGLDVQSDLAEDAILVCNLFDCAIKGRDKIESVLRTLERYFLAVSDARRINSAGHLIIQSDATLPSGQKISMTVFGTRDDGELISEIALTFDDLDDCAELNRLVYTAAMV